MHAINGFAFGFDTWVLISSMLSSGSSVRSLIIYRVPNIEGHTTAISISISPFKSIFGDTDLSI